MKTLRLEAMNMKLMKMIWLICGLTFRIHAQVRNYSSYTCIMSGRMTLYISILWFFFHGIVGGLTCRAILQSFQTNVHTFVSLSSPQAGQYGGIANMLLILALILKTVLPMADTDYLNFLFPNFTKENLYLWAFVITTPNHAVMLLHFKTI